MRSSNYNAGPFEHSICEAALAHSEGDDHALRRPIAGDGAAQLGAHRPVYQLAPQPYRHLGSHYRRAAPFGPNDDDFIVVSVA